MIKRITKLIVSICVFTLDFFIRIFRQILNIKIPGRCVVLCYHAVPIHLLKRFEKQMDSLLRFCIPHTADFTGTLASGQRFVVVTFDDGFQSVLDNAVSVLKDRSIPFTLFVLSHRFDCYPDWIKDTDYPDRHEKIMSLIQINSIDTSLVNIGSHSMTHPELTLLSKEDAWNEISESKNQIETIIKREIELFAFPDGQYSEDLISLARTAGYKRVFTVDPVYAFCRENEFVTGRFDVSPSYWQIEFLLVIFGAYRWLPYAFKLKRLVLKSF